MKNAKTLSYHGMQPSEDVMPKVKYEDIPEDRREKWESHLATFDGVVDNDQEFEEWLAVYVHVVWMDGDYKRYIASLKRYFSELSSCFRHDFRLSLRNDVRINRHDGKI